MRVLILNTCSTLNRGDAAIVLGQIRLLRKLCPSARIAITSRTPCLDRAFFDPLEVEVLAPLTPALSNFSGARNKLIEGVRSLTAWEHKQRLVQTLQQSDLVLSCGGGYFYSYRRTAPGSSYWQNVLQAYLAKAMGKPLVFMPQSFGPFTSWIAQQAVKSLLEGNSVLKVFAREEVSHRLLRHFLEKDYHAKLGLCPDMAFYLQQDADLQNFDRTADLPSPVLILNLREWSFPETGDAAVRYHQREQYLSALAEAATYFMQHYHGTVVVVPQALGPDPAEDDRGVCLAFYQRVRAGKAGGGKILFRQPDTGSLSAYCKLLAGATLLIGARLHACILALIAGTPAISVGYQYKSQGTMEMLGLNRFHISITEISSDWLINRIDEIVTHHQEYRQEIRQGLDQARTQINDQVGSLLASLVKKFEERISG